METLKLEVTTHSGISVVIEESKKTVAEINDERNDREVDAILIGGHSFARVDLKNICPIEVEEIEQEQEDSYNVQVTSNN